MPAAGRAGRDSPAPLRTGPTYHFSGRRDTTSRQTTVGGRAPGSIRPTEVSMVAIGHDDVVRERGHAHDHAHRPPPAQDRAASPVVKFHAPEVVFGIGALAEAGFAAARLGARRPFVVTDDGV